MLGDFFTKNTNKNLSWQLNTPVDKALNKIRSKLAALLPKHSCIDSMKGMPDPESFLPKLESVVDVEFLVGFDISGRFDPKVISGNPAIRFRKTRVLK